MLGTLAAGWPSPDAPHPPGLGNTKHLWRQQSAWYPDEPAEPWRTPQGRKIDFVRRDAANHRLGRLGEQFAVELERKRLLSSGRDDLAKKVECISDTNGDGLGFDVLSFDEVDDSERLIEVKTTTMGKFFPSSSPPTKYGVRRRWPGSTISTGCFASRTSLACTCCMVRCRTCADWTPCSTGRRSEARRSPPMTDTCPFCQPDAQRVWMENAIGVVLGLLTR